MTPGIGGGNFPQQAQQDADQQQQQQRQGAVRRLGNAASSAANAAVNAAGTFVDMTSGLPRGTTITGVRNAAGHVAPYIVPVVAAGVGAAVMGMAVDSMFPGAEGAAIEPTADGAGSSTTTSSTTASASTTVASTDGAGGGMPGWAIGLLSFTAGVVVGAVVTGVCCYRRGGSGGGSDVEMHRQSAPSGPDNGNRRGNALHEPRDIRPGHPDHNGMRMQQVFTLTDSGGGDNVVVDSNGHIDRSGEDNQGFESTPPPQRRYALMRYGQGGQHSSSSSSTTTTTTTTTSQSESSGSNTGINFGHRSGNGGNGGNGVRPDRDYSNGGDNTGHC